MVKVLKKEHFILIEIDAPYREDFKCAEGTLSDFHSNAISWVGDAIMPEKCVGVFCDNNYWWDEGNEPVRWSVFMTQNGNLMLKNWNDGRLWRVEYTR